MAIHIHQWRIYHLFFKGKEDSFMLQTHEKNRFSFLASPPKKSLENPNHVFQILKKIPKDSGNDFKRFEKKLKNPRTFFFQKKERLQLNS